MSTFVAALLLAAQITYQKEIPANNVAVDQAGNVYTAGTATITKLDATGNQIYSNQLNIPGTWNAIAADGAGNLVLVGTTTADNLPTTPAVLQPQRNTTGKCVSGDMAATPIPCPDAFVVKLDTNGNLAWATYLGGSVQDQGNALAIDATGNIYVAGFTQSADFPSVSAFQPALGGYADGFVTKISADGTRILYSTFVGGAGYDMVHALAVDSIGNAYVVGELQGMGLGPTCEANITNAFLIKLAPTGDRLNYGGCQATTASASATAVAIDNQGNAFIGGVAARYEFIRKISADGTTQLYSYSLEARGVFSLAVDATGAAYVTGQTSSPLLPITGPALQPCAEPSYLAFNLLLKLDPAGAAPTYLSYEEAPARVALAPDGSLYEAFGSLRKITNLDTPGAPFLSRWCVLNGASFASHLDYGQPGISPGEIVTLKGTGLGPAAPPPVAFGYYPTSLAGVQVLFDGVPGPLLYVQDHQVNVVAPYSLAGKTQTSIQVQNGNQSTQPVTVPVAATSVAVFGNTVFNQDFSVNSASNPTTRGSAIILFITGAGQTAPPSTDGQVWQTAGGLQTTVSAQIQSINISPNKAVAPVLYAGPAPTLISGVQQINIQIPPNLPPAFFSPVTAGNGFITVSIGSQSITVPVVVR